jgi:hypothetical protein
MPQRLQVLGHLALFIGRTTRFPVVQRCGSSVMEILLSYANRGVRSSRDGVTEERAIVRASDNGGALVVYMLRFSDDGAGYGGLDT